MADILALKPLLNLCSVLPSLGFYPEISGFFEAVGIFIFILKSQSRDFLRKESSNVFKPY
jgi:hypothetical protein